jgi:hypothetical protein
MIQFWTGADDAELDVLVHALTIDFDEHRRNCRACQPCDWPARWKKHKAACRVCDGLAPLTFGTACEERDRLREHNKTCPACSGPCPHLRAAIAEVLEWREARALLSKAEHLRAELESAA